MTSETSLSILELMLSFPGALLLGNLCIIRAISSGIYLKSSFEGITVCLVTNLYSIII